MNFSKADSILSQAIDTVTPSAQLVVRSQGHIVHNVSLGWLDPETKSRPINSETLFDLASVTKLFTVTAFMTLVEQVKVSLDNPVCTVLPEFNGMRPILPYENPLDWGTTVSVSETTGVVDAGKVTFRHLLVHNSGLPAWRAFKDQPNAQSAVQLALDTFFSYPTGEMIVYSDVGLVLLGLSLSRLSGTPIDEAIYQRVTRPLSLGTRFLPVATTSLAEKENIAPTEFCQWRGRRIIGEVHDENTWRLGGVAGHAGLFSNALDLAAFGQSYLDASLLRTDTILEMTRLQAAYGMMRRGLGFSLWSPDPEASSHPFSQLTYGHTGFTGTCLWIDPTRQLVVAFLTNDVYNGRESRGIGGLRVQVHQAIVESVDAG